MISATEYDSHDAMGLAQLVADGGATASELTEMAISRIEELNPTLNAVITTDFDRAREAAAIDLAAGRLHGVPWLVKDLGTNVEGLPATNGSRSLADNIAPADSELIRRHRAAGLNLLGKTNTPEMGMNVCTAPALFGPTPNPHDPTRSAGGSSGGSACAVAAGILPAAHATDSGGSIRIPASNCGLFGLKPTRARVPLGNDLPEGLGGLSTGHAVTHSVRDSALLLDLTAGPMPGDAYAAPTAPVAGFLAAIGGPLSPLKVAVWTEGFDDEPISQECRSAALTAAALCESLGCRVVEERPPVDGAGLRRTLDVLFSANIAANIRLIRGGTDDAASETLFEPVTLAAAAYASRLGAVDYVGAIAAAQAAARALGRFFEEYDVLLTPTLANPPLPLGELSTDTHDWPAYLSRMLDEIPFTPLFNVTGGPAASVPLGLSADGLPIGVQFGAALGSETILLQLAAALEIAAPWHQRT